MEARGLQEGAALKAKAQGGKPADYLQDKDVRAFAHEYRKEQMFQNGNQAAQHLRFHGKSPAMQIASKAIFPFATVPMNLAGRGIELSGAGLPLAAGRALGARLTGSDPFAGRIVPEGATPAEAEAATAKYRRALALQAGRGIAGGALGAAGYGLAGAGVLNPPDSKTHQAGSVNLGRNKYDIGRLQPLSTPLLEGAEAYGAAHGRGANPLATLDDNPYLNVGEQAQGVREGLDGKPKQLQRVVGGLIGPLSPTMLSQIAAATDPSGNVRKKNTAWDYLENRVPGLREHLEATPYPQASNYKSTGLLSLLSPVNVTPRVEEDTPAGHMMREMSAARAPAGGTELTPEKQAARQVEDALRVQARSGKDIRPLVVRAIRAGTMTATAGVQLLGTAKLSAGALAFRRVPVADAFKVWGAASADQKAQWKGLFRDKLLGAADRGTLTPAQVDRARSLGLLPPAPSPAGVRSLSEYQGPGGQARR